MADSSHFIDQMNTNSVQTLEEAVAGCLLGGALGDSIGAPFENMPPGERTIRTSSLTPTDDTQLTLATCTSITKLGDIQPDHIAATFLHCYHTGRISGPGAATMQALRGLEAGGHWALVGRQGEQAAGNGAAMRVAPLAFILDPGTLSHRTLLRDITRITHRNDEAWVGALAILTAVRYAWTTGDVSLPAVTALLPDSRVRDCLYHIETMQPDSSLADMLAYTGTSGFVAESVPAALCAARYALRAGLPHTWEQLISQGGDTDTICSMTGNIAGAALGDGHLPAHLIRGLTEAPAIRQTARDFTRTVVSLQQKFTPDSLY